jgi:hypothetical protein
MGFMEETEFQSQLLVVGKEGGLICTVMEQTVPCTRIHRSLTEVKASLKTA